MSRAAAQWREQALNRQREEEARVRTLQKFVATSQALGDANAR
jgi:hypothetical protein